MVPGGYDKCTGGTLGRDPVWETAFIPAHPRPLLLPILRRSVAWLDTNAKGTGCRHQGKRISSEEHLEEIPIIPSSFEPFGLDTRAATLLLPQEARRQVAQHRKVMRGMIAAQPTLILVEDDIEHPVQPIFNPPVVAELPP